MNNGHPWMEQAVVAQFLRSGSFENHLAKIRHAYMLRRDCLVGELEKHFGQCRLDGLEGGMHASWHLPESACDAFELQERLKNTGVGIYSLRAGPAHRLVAFPGDDRIVLLGYPCLSERKIVEAIDRIARVVGGV